MKYLSLILLIVIISACSSSSVVEISEIEASDTVVISGTGDTENVIEDVELSTEISYDILSLPTIMSEDISGYDLVLEEVLSRTNQYTRYRISYMNGDLKLSGIMNIPIGDGPFPLLVLNHGYIDIRYYTNGRGLKREQDYFARNGFAVIHPDYRNHAFSDKADEEPYDFRFGYVRDVITSVLAVQGSILPELTSIDTDSVGMLGHSMGGGISQNISVVAPDLIDALVLYGTVSNDEYRNFVQFQFNNTQRSVRVEQVLRDYGTQEENPLFWEGISSSTFIGNITAPVMIFTGTADADTPTQWSQDIGQELIDAGKEVEIVSYPGEVHEFGGQWSDFMKRSGEFFSEELKSE